MDYIRVNSEKVELRFDFWFVIWSVEEFLDVHFQEMQEWFVLWKSRIEFHFGINIC